MIWIRWLKFAITIFCLILIGIGFLFGYIYANNSNDTYNKNPLIYGIVKINELNNDKFNCYCSSMTGITKSFSFNEDGINNPEEEFFLEAN